MPAKEEEGNTATKEGDTLKLARGETTYEIMVSGDTLTMVGPGVKTVFTFYRVAS